MIVLMVKLSLCSALDERERLRTEVLNIYQTASCHDGISLFSSFNVNQRPHLPTAIERGEYKELAMRTLRKSFTTLR